MSLVYTGGAETTASGAAPTDTLPQPARVYGISMLVAALAALGWQLTRIVPPDPLVWLVLAAMAGIGARLGVAGKNAASGLSASFTCAVDVAALLLYGPAVAMITAAAGALAHGMLARQPARAWSMTFSAAAAVVSVQIASTAVSLLGGPPAPQAMIGGASTYFAADMLLVGAGTGLASGRRIASVLSDAISDTSLHSFIGLAAGVAAVHVARAGQPAAAAFMMAPLYFVYRAYRRHLERIAAAEAQEREIAALRSQLVAGEEIRGGRPRRSTNVFEDIRLAHREVYTLYEIAQSMSTRLGVTDTMTLIATKLSALVPFSSCALFLRKEENGPLACRFATGVDAELLEQLEVPAGQGLVGWVARHQRPLVNARPGAELEAAGVSGPTTLRSAMVCPLVFGGRLIGTLALYHEQPAAFTDDHRRLLERICEQAAGVVHNSILYEQTKRESLTDPLTGLPNTRFLSTHVARELARAERRQSEVSLLVLDLDGFKEINDRYGHGVGDRALREVARVLADAIRPYDICVRYAGDEFVIVLSDCGREEAENKRKELQQAISALQLEVAPAVRITLGSSCGSASFPRDAETYESLLALADRRMYEDKRRRKLPAESQAGTAPRPRQSVFAKIPTDRRAGGPGAAS